MVMRHMAYKKKYPDRPLPHAMPYEGIENLRPETLEMLRVFALGRPGQ
jgi:arylsulfatase